ncbi:DEAH (Asp-Glu-Ala-His) box polypeptide 34 [Dinochytrium kinnereticum]|nr:DEAH (Asp-Glu-Ala-His) box polypeptide 34 [Dinochytrium kinnereticum]
MRYNIDGTQREETAQEAAESAALLAGRRLRDLPPPPRPPRDVLLAEARAAVALPKGSKPPPPPPQTPQPPPGRPSALPWDNAADRMMFGREGEAEFRRGSGEYDEFIDFYIRFKSLRDYKKKLDQKNRNDYRIVVDDYEYTVARQALVLFDEFMFKKKKTALEKISKDRANLPIKAYETAIVESVRNNRVVLIAADTGAGKSTQVPQYLLEGGFDKIACTQPRRIACYSLARRVSYESLNIYGSEIAYQGLLLRQFAADPNLSLYNVIIVDEVHERHITGDFLLGVLKRILAVRDDIRLVLMSATINAELFSQYFNAPVFNIPGRVFPVRIEYLPANEEDRNVVDDSFYKERTEGLIKESISAKTVKFKPEPYLRILERIDQVVPAHERGDLLIFMSGINEITNLADSLKPYAQYTKRWIILMLHSALSVKEQEKVFDVAPAGVRKCILSTNIAETSVTIDGIRFIIDSGKVKEMGFDSKTGISKLSEYWISQSSAKQRTGRAGRTGPGECFRLYSAKEHDRLNEFPIPEIMRMPLEPTLLQILAYGLGDPREFDLIEKPSELTVNNAIFRLENLGALEQYAKSGQSTFSDFQNVELETHASNSELVKRPSKISKAAFAGSSLELTPLGRVLSILPVNVVLGKMLILGTISDVIDSTIVMVAALTVPCPFSRVPDSRNDIASNRKWLQSEIGDPFTLLSLFSEWLRVKEKRQSSQNWCRRHGVEEQRLYEMVKLKTQFEIILAEYMAEEEGGSDSEVDDDSESDESARSLSRRGKKRKRGRQDIGEDETENRKSPFWKNPEYIRRREQKMLLERQKRLQATGKRKILKVDDGEGDEAEENEAEELLHPKKEEVVEQQKEGAETLETLRQRPRSVELLCYLELLQTNKPYLTNVMRVPAAPVCLLFAHKLDISPDCKHIIVDEWLQLRFKQRASATRYLILANWLRIAWDLVINKRLKRVKHGLVTAEIGIEKELKQDSSSDTSPNRKRRVLTDWSSFDFIPSEIRRLRNDWESGSSRWKSDVCGEFVNLEREDVSRKLSDFLEVEIEYSIEKLRTQDVPEMSRYPRAREDESSLNFPGGQGLELKLNMEPTLPHQLAHV